MTVTDNAAKPHIIHHAPRWVNISDRGLKPEQVTADSARPHTEAGQITPRVNTEVAGQVKLPDQLIDPLLSMFTLNIAQNHSHSIAIIATGKGDLHTE
jgi:hypothetical protein